MDVSSSLSPGGVSVRPSSPLSVVSSSSSPSGSPPPYQSSGGVGAVPSSVSSYLMSRLSVPLHPEKTAHQRLLSESHKVEKAYAEMKVKVQLARETEAVYEEEKKRQKELGDVLKEKERLVLVLGVVQLFVVCA